MVWYNGKKKRPGCIRSPGIYLTTFYENGLRLNRVALSKKSDSAEYPSQTAYVLEQVFEWYEVIALAAVSVYIVIDSDVAYAEHGKAFLNVETGMKLVTSQSGKVLGDDDSNLTVLHVGNHLLKCGPLEISTGKTVIHIEAGIGKVMVFCKLLQDIFLRRDLSRVFSVKARLISYGARTLPLLHYFYIAIIHI